MTSSHILKTRLIQGDNVVMNNTGIGLRVSDSVNQSINQSIFIYLM